MRSSGSPFALQERVHDPLDRLRPVSCILARVAEHHHRKLQPFRLMDGQERDAALREGVFGVLVLGLAAAEEGKQVGAEQAVRAGRSLKRPRGDDRAVLIHEPREVLRDQAQVADRAFVLAALSASNIALK